MAVPLALRNGFPARPLSLTALLLKAATRMSMAGTNTRTSLNQSDRGAVSRCLSFPLKDLAFDLSTQLPRLYRDQRRLLVLGSVWRVDGWWPVSLPFAPASQP
jgi:hypothetical protein